MAARAALCSNGAVNQPLVPDVPLSRCELGRADVVPLHEDFTVEAGHRARVAILPELCGNDGFDATTAWPVVLLGDEVHPLTDQHQVLSKRKVFDTCPLSSTHLC